MTIAASALKLPKEGNDSMRHEKEESWAKSAGRKKERRKSIEVVDHCDAGGFDWHSDIA